MIFTHITFLCGADDRKFEWSSLRQEVDHALQVLVYHRLESDEQLTCHTSRQLTRRVKTTNNQWNERRGQTITWAVSEYYNKYVISQKLKSLEIDLYTASRILTSSMRREPFLSLGNWKRVYDVKHRLVPCINSAQRENFDLSMF